MNQKEIILKWVETFNSDDAKKIAEFYHEEAVNHQVANEPIKSRDAICKMFEMEFSSAEMTYIVERIYEDGNWVILERKDPLGSSSCGFFEIIEGKIKFQRGYWDKLSFLKMHQLPIPQ